MRNLTLDHRRAGDVAEFAAGTTAVEACLSTSLLQAQRLGELSAGYMTQEGKKRLQTHIHEAADGGRSLTDVETLRGRQAGMLPAAD